MTLHLKEGIQIGSFHFVGMVELKELAQLLEEYPFEEEVLEKAAVHRRSMESGIAPFQVTLRLEPGSFALLGEEEIVFEFGGLELRDGKSKAAALLGLSADRLEGSVKAHIFLTTREQMDKLENNQI
ncbi:MAG TPA: hypothetical protein IAB26_14625 [Candidatus Limivivens merdigallinarum]|uniref:Uncharacterized protein n=1 Tax=Candidatus Limivivens merdigallinarum TaxID=2840859 RepID=A0A9D0ZYM6_9FIRM|nr:hypothetical protein [Candidatus Limivivens merdigallinarum]